MPELDRYTNIQDAQDILLEERKLWAAVVKMAVDDLRLDSYSKAPGKDARNAGAWIANNDEHVGSFLWVCDFLKIDPVSIREKVLKEVAWK